MTLNEDDLIELQVTLQELKKSPVSDTHVQRAKSAFLRSKNELRTDTPPDPEADPDCHPRANMDIATSSAIDHVMDVGDLSQSKVDVPILSGATSSSTAVHTTGVGDLVDPSKSEGDSPSAFSSELKEVSDDDDAFIADDVFKAAPMMFPCKIRYLDLTVLGLKARPRVPALMQIRSEWDLMMQTIEQQFHEGVQGSIVITGQPGIGQHVYTSFTIVV